MLPGRAYLHAKFHLDPSNHLATIHQRRRQTDRQQTDSIGRTILQMVAQKWNEYLKILNSWVLNYSNLLLTQSEYAELLTHYW